LQTKQHQASSVFMTGSSQGHQYNKIAFTGGIIMKSTLLIAPILALTLATATAAPVDTLATQAPVAIEYVAATPAAPVIVTADALGTFYDVINFGYKYLPDPPWLGLVDVIFG
jgi:hypothetical protein